MIDQTSRFACTERARNRSAMLAKGIVVALSGLVMLSACAAAPTGDEAFEQMEAPAAQRELVLYSPSPVRAELHVLNVEYGKILAECGVAESVEVVSVALPDSINEIATLPSGKKSYHLPIVTTLDFAPAISGTAPDWHSYEENSDLRFVTGLYEVAFGVMVFDPVLNSSEDLVGKRIAVPSRPSAVRWFAEALFRDGWKIEDQVTFVEMRPPEVADALARGDVDAVVWNLMHQTPEGYSPLLPVLANLPNAKWIDADMATIEAINEANTFTTAPVIVDLSTILGVTGKLEGTAQMMSFQQGLTAWSSTPDGLINDILDCMAVTDLPFGTGQPVSAHAPPWPGLKSEQIHSAAR